MRIELSKNKDSNYTTILEKSKLDSRGVVFRQFFIHRVDNF